MNVSEFIAKKEKPAGLSAGFLVLSSRLNYSEKISPPRNKAASPSSSSMRRS